MIYEDILSLLIRENVPHKIHEHTPSVTFQDAADYLDFPLEQLVKTIAFRIKNGNWILAAIQGAERVDYKKLAAYLGTSRDKLVRLTPEQVEAELGYQIGAVAPFSTNLQTKVVFESSLLPLRTVFCGTGRRDRTLEISISDLVRFSGGSTASILQQTSPG